MNLPQFLLRRPLGRVLHQVVTAVMVASLLNSNQPTLLGAPISRGGVLIEASPLRRIEGRPMAIPARRDGETGWTLGKPVPRFTQIPLGEAGGQFGAPIGPSADQPEPTGWWTEPELAEAPPGVEEPCISLLARAKSGKVQLVWSQLPEVQLYEIYRAADAESIVFERIGEADGNGWTYLDDNLPNELTYLYLVRALAPDWSCDSEVSSAHPTAARRPANYPPVIYSQPPSQGLARTHYFYLIQATDPNPEDVVVYGLLTGPPGMTVDPQTGWLRWLAEAGRHIVTVAAADGRGGIDVQMFSIDIFESNSAPVAQAGPDQTVFVGQTVTLDGSGSSDADGDPLTFFWSFASLPPGSAAVLSDATAVQPTFVVDQPGAYTVQLIVNDGFVDSAPDTVTISTDNSDPVAQAGLDQTVFVGQTVTLDGSGSSDADGDPLSFFWSFTSLPPGSAAALSDPTAVNPTFVVDQPGAYTVQLIVNDGFVDSAPDTVTISTDNSDPVAQAGPDQTVFVGQTVTLNGSGSSDADGDPLTFFWSFASLPPGSAAALSDPTAFNPTFLVDQPGAYTVQLIVHDGFVDSAPDTVVISTDNSAPVAQAGPAQTVFVGQTVTLDGSASSDADGDPLSFFWSFTSLPPGSAAALSDPTAVNPTFLVDQPGAYTVQLIVHDGFIDGAPDTVTISTDNSAPVAQAGPAQTVFVGQTVTLDGSGSSDADGDPLSFFWSFTSLPPGSAAALSDPTAVNPTFLVDQPGAYTVQLIVNDGFVDGAPDTVTISTDNSAPVANAGPDQTVFVGQTVTLDGSGSSDADGDPLTFFWSFTSVPPGSAAALSDPTAVNPTFLVDQPGAYTVQLIVNDGLVDSAPDTVTISAAPVMAIVPNVVGLTQAAAESAITSAGLTVGSVTGSPHPTVPAGQVISQAPAAGASVTLGSPVALVVSLGSGTPVLVSIEVSPAALTLAAGETRQYAATGTWSDARVEDVSGSVVWVSTQPVVASLTTSGLATALDPGITTIQATLNGITGGTSLTVEAPGLAAIIVTPEQPTVLVGQSQSFTAMGVRTDGTGQDLSGLVTWESSLSAVAEVSGDGMAAALSPGTTQMRALFGGIAGAATLTVHAVVTDSTPPTVAITAPANNATLTEPTDIIGTANDANFLKYTLEYAPAGDTTFILLSEETTPVVNGVLGRFDPTLLLNDLYTVRLTAFDRAGNTASITRTYQVARDQKVGIFTLTFQDLNVPVSGLPITINRVYDSRDKAKGDFGIGWRLDIQTLKARANRVQGTGWQVNLVGGFLFWTYVMVPTTEHKVTITLPDGKVEEFDLAVNPSSSLLFPFIFVTPTYVPRAGTVGTLTPTSVGDLYVNGSQPGTVDLVDFLSFAPYDPQEFHYTSADGRVFRISKSLGVRSVVDPNGNTLTIGSGGILHSSGKSVSFLRDAQGRITQITDPNGNVQRYAYNANGDLISHTDALGHTTRYLYNLSHGLLEIRDPSGNRPVRNEYDENGRLIAHIDAAGHRIEYARDVGARQELVQDRLGRVTLFDYDVDGNVLAQTDALGNPQTFTYDARGNRLTETDPLGNTTTSTYDTRNNVLTQTDPLGNVTAFTYNARNQVLTTTDALGQVTTHAYDARGNLLSTTDPLGNVTTHTYDARGNLSSTTDPLGRTTTMEYDGAGNLTSEVNPLGHLTSYTYDANGNRLSETKSRTDEDGNPVAVVTTFAYDAQNRLIRTTDAHDHVSLVEYDATGRQSATADPLGTRTTYQYDARGNLVQTTYPDGSTETRDYDAESNLIAAADRAGRVTQYEYDAVNRLTRTVFPDGASTQTEYDAAGRQIAVVDERGNRITHEYDAAGRNTLVIDALGHVSAYTYDANGQRTQFTDANGNTITYQYDAAGRPTRVTWPNGLQVVTEYDAAGQRIAITDEAGLRTQYAYDGLSRLEGVTDPIGGVTAYAYDELGNRVVQTDANGHTTRFAFDSLGRMIKRTLPLGMSEHLAYDAAGNLIARTDFNGHTTTYTYDSDWRLTQRAYPDGSTGSFTYTPTGQRATATSARGTTVYAYDVRDRLVSVADPTGAVIAYTYDSHGNRTSLTVPSGNTTFTYDILNRLATVTDPSGGITTYDYNGVGNRSRLTYPNGTVATYTYDNLNRLTALVNATAAGAVLSSYSYTLGPRGNRTRVVEASGRTVDYTYDDVARLVAETISDPVHGNQTFNYTYDPVGNRLTKTDAAGVTAYLYDANDRLLAEGGNTYTYDANGNTLSRAEPDGATTVYFYDFENRLRSAVVPGKTLEYDYDEDGLRVASVVNGVPAHYLVDKNRDYAQVLEERTHAGVLTVAYIHGDDLVSQHRAAGASYYHYDGHGSTRALTSPAQAITDTYIYEAFGLLLTRTGTTDNDYLYAGEQLDANVGFYYLRARYYAPAIGRFVTMDVFPGDPQSPVSLHKYLYANTDPVNLVDPSGQISLFVHVTAWFAVRMPFILPGLYVVQRIAMQLQTFQIINAIRLASSGFTQRVVQVFTRQPALLKTGKDFERLISPVMRLLGGEKQQRIRAVVDGVQSIKVADWITRANTIVDAKLGQSLDFSQLAVFVRWAQANGGSVVYVTLSRTPPQIVDRAVQVGEQHGVVVRFIHLLPF